jgi:DNA invertase Pin-like site-specific DNA recombinase
MSKVEARHLERPAYIYVRQSSMAQVRHHQESTERQYALRNKACELGWPTSMTRVLDGDLGQSGAHSSGREDFKILVADVSMGRVGAVMSLEASRLARSNADWHRLIELCSLTDTLIIDEDGCYSPSDFNDGLLLGLKATMSQAELHLLRARLQGGRLNKAKKGELYSHPPAGLVYDDEGRVVLDPDEEICGAVRLVFALFRQTGTAYGVVKEFNRRGLGYPKRPNEGIWNGQLRWGRLTLARALDALKNPSYAGAYVYGRFERVKQIDADGNIRSRVRAMPMSSWKIVIEGHHEGYVSWEEYLANLAKLDSNRTNGEQTLLSGPAREGIALVQGLLLCGRCGHRLSVHYEGTRGRYPAYQCSVQLLGAPGKTCMRVRCGPVDEAVSKRVLEVLQPAELELAAEALHELEIRDEAMGRQWRMRIDRAEYEAQLAQRRYEEVDPSNRLVAATLERRWNEALEKVEQTRSQYAEFQRTEGRATTPEQKARISSLAKDLPRLWNAPTTRAKDKKRMLRLLIRDITVEKLERKALLHVRWQGGATEDILVELKRQRRRIYTEELVEQVRELAFDLRDEEIAASLNEQGKTSASGKPFTTVTIRCIRQQYGILVEHPMKRPGEYTVPEVAARFGVDRKVVYYWMERGLFKIRRPIRGSRCLLAIEPGEEQALHERARRSTRNTDSPGTTDSHSMKGAL